MSADLRDRIAKIIDPIFDNGAGRISREWALSKADSILRLPEFAPVVTGAARDMLAKSVEALTEQQTQEQA